MKLEVENWARENLNENAMEIFEESIICYKAGAYRSAYIMSYLAFKQTIRERVIETAQHPDSFTQEEWNNKVIVKLKDDSHWEGYLNKIVVQEQVEKNKKDDIRLNEIFKYSNSNRIICRFKYWRDIRNSCAHAKNERINSSTVEQFWNYIYDDLSEFYVLGGKEYLMNELMDSYKYYISDNGKNLGRLIMDIKIVYKDEIELFFDVFLDNLRKVNSNFDFVDESNVGFWKKIICNQNDEIIKGFIMGVAKKKEIFLNFYKFFNVILQLIIENDSKFIQDYINPLLCRTIQHNKFLLNDNFWSILSNNIIYKDSIININTITSNVDNFILIDRMNLDEYKICLLNKYNVLKLFILNAGRDFFNNNSQCQWDYYSYGNPIKDSMIIKYFNLVKWDEQLIEKIDNAYTEIEENMKSRTNHGSCLNANTRLKVYQTIITDNMEKIKKYCDDNDIDLSQYNNII